LPVLPSHCAGARMRYAFPLHDAASVLT